MRFAESSGDNLLLLSCPAPFSRALGRRITKVYSGRGGPALLWNHLTRQLSRQVPLVRDRCLPGLNRGSFRQERVARRASYAITGSDFRSELDFVDPLC